MTGPGGPRQDEGLGFAALEDAGVNVYTSIGALIDALPDAD